MTTYQRPSPAKDCQSTDSAAYSYSCSRFPHTTCTDQAYPAVTPAQHRPDSHSSVHQAFVATWSASPVPPDDSGPSHDGFEDQTLRLIVHTSIGGPRLRIRLTNTFGKQAVTFDHVEVGIHDTGAAVIPGTNTRVTFGGEISVTIPAGAIVYSDSVALSVAAEQDLAVSLHAPNATGCTTWHPVAQQASYLSEGDHAGQIVAEPFSQTLDAWYFLEGIDVLAPAGTSAIVALGNSITDGYLSTVNVNHRWPDYLVRRLNHCSDVHRSVVNAGISGNRILHDSLPDGAYGTNALARFNRDVLAQPGVSDVIVLEGINDIGQNPPTVSADEIIAGLKQIAIRAHAHGLKIFVGTLTPTAGAEDRYGSPEGLAKREQVNRFIRTGNFFDGVIDFDLAIRDTKHPDRMLPQYDSGDHLHPSDAGYQAMAQAIDLSLFGKSSQIIECS